MPAPPKEAAAVQATVKHLRALTAAAEAYRISRWAAEGSPEKAAISAARGNDAGEIAELLLCSADYHLLTFAAALSTNVLYPLGGYSLLRGAAEPAARAA
jgi:hypothetical protein